MKYLLYSIGILLTVGISVIMWNTSKMNNIKIVEVVKTDTLYIYEYDTIYIEHIKDIIDLNNKIDSLNSALFIANYKLGRIKEYNDIAAKNNNIKFLRGWINRVLNE
jgi:hypothetical protein